jgi:hypothetical protein
MTAEVARLCDPVDALRRRLLAAGFRPVPLATGEKYPTARGWADTVCRGLVDAATADSLNTGIACAGLRVVDVDVDVPEIVARVRELAESTLGAAPVRSRPNSARVALLYRAAEGEPRKRVLAGRAGKIEVLGNGQLLLAFGAHPSGADLHWSPQAPDVVHLTDLPAVTESQIADFLSGVAPLIGAEARE